MKKTKNKNENKGGHISDANNTVESVNNVEGCIDLLKGNASYAQVVNNFKEKNNVLLDDFEGGNALLDKFEGGNALLDKFEGGNTLLDKFEGSNASLNPWKQGKGRLVESENSDVDVDSHNGSPKII